MKANYKAWEDTQQDSNGLFWSIDTRDAMEKSISGDGYRPTLNSYMYGDARAIAKMAAAAGDQATAAEFNRKADTLHTLIETRLWNPKDQFYEVMSPAADSGIRQQKRFIDPGTTMQLAGVREQIGYIPWSSTYPQRRTQWPGSSSSIRRDSTANMGRQRPSGAARDFASPAPTNAPGTARSGPSR